MFNTRVWMKAGLVIVIGPPGTEKCVVSEHVLREAKQSGLSTRKSYHKLDKSQKNGEIQVVSFT